MLKSNDVLTKISNIHNGDKSQLSVITSENPRMIIEASAGSGKTKTLISSVAYNIATGLIPSTKKILALTFSVNAAYKIKKDVIEQLPILFEDNDFSDTLVSKKILVSNYHGLCRKILGLYGFKLSDILTSLNEFNIIDDKKIPNEITLLDDEKEIIKNIIDSISDADIQKMNNNIEKYNEIILMKIVSHKYITYNSIITLVIELFKRYPILLKQYQNLFELIIVDEYQDTNLLGYILLKMLITDKTRLLFFGDPLQRIYGFIGAIPNIMDITKEKFNMKKIVLEQNYRFKDNPELLKLDRVIRLNSINSPNIQEISNPNIICSNNYDSEYTWIISKVLENISSNINSTILVKSLNNNFNTQYLLSKLKERDIPFFYALFTDESEEYILFHEHSYKELKKSIKDKKVVNKKILEKFYSSIMLYYQSNSNPIYSSLLILLRKFIDSIYDIYSKYRMEDLINFIYDVLENKGLKQYMNKIDEKLIIATIHAYKGLESECIIVADLESYNFPGYYTCSNCSEFGNGCRICGATEKQFLEELSVFYVAITRAKKDLYLTYSLTQRQKYGVKNCNKSCLLNLYGIGNENLIKI